MTDKELSYAVSVLKGQKTDLAPDFYALLGFLYSHKVAGLFYSRAEKSGTVLPYKVNKLLGETFEKQKRKAEFFREHISGISEKLMRGRIEHAFLKGSVLSNVPVGGKEIYSCGERTSDDIDVLVKPDGISVVCEALRELGFTQGRYDWKENKIRPFTRAEVLARRMNRGEVAPFVRLTGNAEFPFVEVDVNFSLGNTPSEGGELLNHIVSSAREYRGKTTLTAPSPEAFMLHLVMHQYKECELYFSVKRAKDLDLYKLADIYYLFCAGACDILKVKTLAKEFGVSDKLGAVLAQAGEAFCESGLLRTAEELGCAQPQVTDYANGKKYVFTATVRERLLCSDSARFLKEA